MTTVATASKYRMLPYDRQGEIDYASLEFKPDQREIPPDHMEQSRHIMLLFALLDAWLTDFDSRADIFIDTEAIICYDPTNLNVRVSPDMCIAFGVDRDAIIERRIYLPWEAGKPPDWVLEVASESTGRVDVGRKLDIYRDVGAPEYWQFDPSGGDYHGRPLAGYALEYGVYQPTPLTREPDGILKGYSPVLGLSLSWVDGVPRMYDPSTGEYLTNWREERHAWESERAEWDEERTEWDEERAEWGEERAELMRRNARLQEQLRRLQAGS